mmetsp:Transcript_40922/g.46993  ORF Transcript_40922/g.46993 Transcript_40922/m.46993 type:complete len:287 (+) Transcript_40922:1244-2104(+)
MRDTNSDRAQPVQNNHPKSHATSQAKQNNVNVKKHVSYVDQKQSLEAKSKVNLGTGKSLAYKEKVTLGLHGVEEQNTKVSEAKSKTASTTRVSKHAEFVPRAKGMSFGILAKKNEQDQRRASRSRRYDENTRDEEYLVNPLSCSIPNFTDIRNSVDPMSTKSFRDPSASEKKTGYFQRENIMNRKRNDLDELKITPLQERKSLTRKLRMNTITRKDNKLSENFERDSKQVPEPSPVPKMQNLVQINIHDQSMEVGEDEMLSTYSIFTKIIAGTLERLGGDEALQLS